MKLSLHNFAALENYYCDFLFLNSLFSQNNHDGYYNETTKNFEIIQKSKQLAFNVSNLILLLV